MKWWLMALCAVLLTVGCGPATPTPLAPPTEKVTRLAPEQPGTETSTPAVLPSATGVATAAELEATAVQTSTPAVPSQPLATPKPSPTFTPTSAPQPPATATPTLPFTPTSAPQPLATATPSPTFKPTSAPKQTPSATPTAAAVEKWQVRTLLAGPGQPGRLYVLLTDEPSGAWPAQRARFLISDDDGKSWSPFPGGLPAGGCVRNVNLDYATPDALYASTCQGLYRWSGSAWVLVSPQETGMVAVVYGTPQIIWATVPFASGGAVIRSDDGGATWTPASSSLVHFNGVANLGIDPRDANTLYAVIWPKYAGSYLRRGAANGQWQTMPTPLNNAQIDTGMTIDGATGALYVTAYSPAGTWELWRTLNPSVPDVNGVQWELVYDFGGDAAWATLLASGWSPQGLALYALLTPWLDKPSGLVGDPVLHRSVDGGQTWSPLPVP